MVANNSGGGSSEPFLSRRRILQAGGVAAGGLTLSNTVAGTEPKRVHTDKYEEKEWGYVRSNFEPPKSTKAAVLGYDAYGPAEPPTHYVRMRDDVLIAVSFEPSGMPSALKQRKEYAPVTASVRGTGCSGGKFELYDRVQARDGYDLVEWIADRSWTLDGVGMYGFSLPGLMAGFTAAETPPSLAAAMPTGVYVDQYRDNRIPGGVRNPTWGISWMIGLRPALSYSGTAKGLADGDELCAQNVAFRDQSHPLDTPATMFTRREDDSQWRLRSLISFVDGIKVPIYVGSGFQDYGVGQRGGPAFYHAANPDPIQTHNDLPGAGPPSGVPGLNPDESPKLLRLTNGPHGSPTSDMVVNDVEAWFDYWLLGQRTGIMKEPRVKIHLNNGSDSSHTTLGLDAIYNPPKADWTQFYLAADGELQKTKPEIDEAASSYLTGNPRQSFVIQGESPSDDVVYKDGPDILYYQSDEFETPKVIAGPITATLYIESTAPDMDLYVSVADEYPDDTIVPLQRGLLRASHRDLDEVRTIRNENGEIIRPYHHHTNPENPIPGETYRYDVEVWPAGHLMYPGHRLLIAIHTPPAASNLFGYEPSRSPGINTVYHTESQPSNILLPLVDWQEDLPPKPAPGEPAAYRTASR